MKEIKIGIKTELPTIAWKELQKFEFNNLKETENRDVSKLKNSIVNSDFSFPFYVWKRYCIDGAGRRKALFELEEEGWCIPPLPYVEIQAESLQEAKKLVLMASSKHGEITQESYNIFIEDVEIPFEEIKIENIDISGNGFEEEGIDFDNIESMEDREPNKKTHIVSCPNCNHSFEVGR